MSNSSRDEPTPQGSAIEFRLGLKAMQVLRPEGIPIGNGSIRLFSPRRDLAHCYLDFVSDTMYRDKVKGHHIEWIYVILPKQPKTKDSASSAPNEDTS